MRLVLLREIPEDADLRRHWNALVERVDQPQVFYTYEWALAVQRSYSAALRPLLFLAYDERNALTGVVALATTGGGRASFLCATTGDYCDFLSLPETKAAFVAEVLAELRRQGIHEVTLTNLPADSATVAALQRAAKACHYHCFARTAYVCAQVALASLERRDEGKPVLPRKKMLRRFLNAMGRESPVRLDHARSWDVIEPVLPQFVQAHVARFLFTGRISNMARKERRVFLAELAKLLSESGWVAVTRMMSGENVFAWNYGFRFQSTWFWYQPTFDSELEKYSPGFCLLAKLIEEAADDPLLRTVDMGLGAEEYKDRFANRTRETLCVTLKSSIGGHLREIARYRAATLVREYPKVESGLRAGLARLQGVRENLSSRGTVGTVSWMGRRATAVLGSQTEIFFYEWCGSARSRASAANLRRLDLDLLAGAASQYIDDPATMTYLLRSAQRLREKTAEGFALVDSAGTPVHFAWATAYDGFFLAELNAKVEAPLPDCRMLFDCWTPTAARGHGYYAQAVECIAKEIQAKGQRAWIFSASTNQSSVRGLEKTRFEKRYRLTRQKFLWWQRVKGSPPVFSEVPAAEVPARG